MSSPQNPRPGVVDGAAGGAHRGGPGQACAGPAAGAARPRPDRARYAWLYEDDDIWGADTAGSTPPLSYGDDWHAPRL